MLVSIYHLHDTERARARRLPVTKPQLLVGSDAKCDIRITDDDQVSPRHMQIAVRAIGGELVGEIHVTPLAGATMIDNAIVSQTTLVRLGDTIRIGNTILKFRPDSVVSVPPPMRDEPPQPTGPQPMRDAPTEPRAPAVPSNFAIPIGNPVPPQPIRPSNPPMPRPMPIAPPLAPLPAPVRHPTYSTDPTENEFLRNLRDAPGDAATRMVYADWLEQRGFAAHASFVRDESAEIFDATFRSDSSFGWRAITSRTSIEYCTQKKCPSRWDRLGALSDDDHARQCVSCGHRVHFCGEMRTLHQLGLRKLPVALDAPVDRVAAFHVYTGNAAPPATIGDNPILGDAGEVGPGDPVDTIRDPED